MNDISLLKELGLSKIARRTHIEAEYLGYIVDKNFEKLARFNVKGFIKILKRELNIDFTQWMSEYEAFIAWLAPWLCRHAPGTPGRPAW